MNETFLKPEATLSAKELPQYGNKLNFSPLPYLWLLVLAPHTFMVCISEFEL